MKKLLFILTISAFTACGSGGSTTMSDSASVTPHDTSNAVNLPIPDTATLNKDPNHMMGDTSNPQKDSMSH